nr:hypothetical protein [Tanacetum cinerariifolium]
INQKLKRLGEPQVPLEQDGYIVPIGFTYVKTLDELSEPTADTYADEDSEEAELEYQRLLAEDQAEQKAKKPIYKQPPRQQWQSAAQQYAQHEATKAIKDITNTTKKQVKAVLKESLATGRSIQETAKALE